MANNRWCAVNIHSVCTGIYLWDQSQPWTAPLWTPTDANGMPIGDPTPQTLVQDTDPPSVHVGDIYDPATGTFSPPA